MTFIRSSFRRLKSEWQLHLGLADAHRHPEIVRHNQRADQEQRSPRSADDIERMHRFYGLDEGIFEEAERRVSAPHQALQNSGHPHRGDVEDDADGRDPEMPVNELESVEPFAIPQPGDQAIQRAERYESDPTQCARMNVTNGPVRVVAERIHD